MKDLHQAALAEIIQGYSVLREQGVEYYFKHPLILDFLKQSLHKEGFEKQADIIGLKSEEDLLQVAYESGSWTKENDETIKSLEFSVKSKNRFLPKVEDIHIKKNLLNQIEEDENELKILNFKKRSFVLASKEAYVSKKMTSIFYSDILFYDKEFKEPITEEDLNKCFIKYFEKFSFLNNRDILLRAAFSSDFFDLFIIFEDISNIFNKTGLDLTIFQKNLLVYGNILISKLKNSYKMPNDIKDNPIKIFEWSEGEKKSKSLDDEDFNIREKVKRAGGLENIKPEDKIT
jgi:hypothetical protein